MRLNPATADLADAAGAVKRVKEQLRAIPDKGTGYGLLRYLNTQAAQALAALPRPQIGFNYLGRFSVATAAEAASALVQELRQNAEQYLNTAGIRWELVHYRGDPAQGLETIAEDRRADCIVVGRGADVPKVLVSEARRPVVVVP